MERPSPTLFVRAFPILKHIEMNVWLNVEGDYLPSEDKALVVKDGNVALMVFHAMCMTSVRVRKVSSKSCAAAIS